MENNTMDVKQDTVFDGTIETVNVEELSTPKTEGTEGGYELDEDQLKVFQEMLLKMKRPKTGCTKKKICKQQRKNKRKAQRKSRKCNRK